MKYSFPRQALSYKEKTKEWAKQCILYAEYNSLMNSSSVRRTVAHKKVNYDLLNGKIHMDDVISLLNPEGFKFDRKDMNNKITHYPLVNKIIELLHGEEDAAEFNYRVLLTNPTAISDKEERKMKEVVSKIQQLVEDESLSDEEYQEQMQKLSRYFSYDYQDAREIAASELLKHYSKEQNFKNIFSDGFVDALAVNEAIFQCSIEGGEPVLRKINPNKIRIYGNGSSNRVEDADMIVIEDYWPAGRIIDTYADQLKTSEIKFLESFYDARQSDSYHSGEYGDPLDFFRLGHYIDNTEMDSITGTVCFKDDGIPVNALPYDIDGNIRVLQVFWKSLRKIKKVKHYNELTGATEYTYHTEDYIPDKNRGEEVKTYYINEAWHGTMIGSGDRAIFVDMGPCKVQYNTMGNPSKCHFGIVGQIFNYNDAKPYSMIDMVKPLSYLYDVTMDRLVRTMNANLGKVLQLNAAMMPAGWDFEKWMYYAKTAGIVLVDPFKEGPGRFKDKAGGTFQVAPVMDAELGNSIQSMVAILQYIEQTLANMVGVTPQRLGAIQNRETVGGVERSTMQSSHTTRWYFEKFNDLKKRVCECFLDTAKVAAKGRNLKFQYITSDLTQAVMDIDGDEFNECEFGIITDNSYDMERLRQQIEGTAQMAVQAGSMAFSSYLRLHSTDSLQEKIKIIEQAEQQQVEMNQQAQQQQQQIEEKKLQAEQAKMQQEDALNQRDNETRILVAQINAMYKKDADGDGLVNEGSEDSSRDLDEKVREFDEKMRLERDKLAWEKQKNKDNNDLKLKIANSKPKTTTK